MIRRTFLKALACSPLGFLVPKTQRRTYTKSHCQGSRLAEELRGYSVDNIVFDEVGLMDEPVCVGAARPYVIIGQLPFRR